MKYICALVVVNDIQKSRYLYESILKQKVITDFGENLAFAGGFALHKKAHFAGLINDREITTQSNNFELYFEEDDVPGVAKEIIKHGFELVHEPREQPWRQLVFRFYDYDHNIIEIGERLEHCAFRLYREGKSLDEIANITYLPVKAVKKAIDEYNKPE